MNSMLQANGVAQLPGPPIAGSVSLFLQYQMMSEFFPSRSAFHCVLTLSPPIPLMLYILPYWSNPPFLISDIWALWRSGLSARAPECQKLKMVG